MLNTTAIDKFKASLRGELIQRKPVEPRDPPAGVRGHSPTISGTVNSPTTPTPTSASPSPPADQPKRAAANSISPTSAKRRTRPNAGLRLGGDIRNGGAGI